MRPAIPEIASRSPQTTNWIVRNPIDAFVVAKLRDLGLPQSPEADRRTLVRRLYFDLVGLPPTPEETAAFLADPRPLAYEELVDRLLASSGNRRLARNETATSLHRGNMQQKARI